MSAGKVRSSFLTCVTHEQNKPQDFLWSQYLQAKTRGPSAILSEKTGVEIPNKYGIRFLT